MQSYRIVYCLTDLIFYRSKPFSRSLLFEYQHFACAKTKAQINFAVTPKLISVFVTATRIVQFLYMYFLNPKVPASSNLLCLYSSVCVGPVRKPLWFPITRVNFVVRHLDWLKHSFKQTKSNRDPVLRFITTSSSPFIMIR